MLDLEHDITSLRGADYNPRHISDADISVLAESIKKLGLVKPIIARGRTIVAGHQRTKALRLLGVTRAPVYMLPRKTTIYDEVRFNQLHNGTDMDCGEENAIIIGGFKDGDVGRFVTVDPKRLSGNMRCPMAPVRNEIARLIGHYGPWGGVVATQDGEVIHCGQYALASILTRSPCLTYVIESQRRAEYERFLNRQYGVFSYDGIERETAIQSYAQMMRLRGSKSQAGRDNRSTLYEQHVIPWVEKNKSARGMDFGSGQGDYARMMRKRGYNILDIELFRRVGASSRLDMRGIRRMINRAAKDMVENGQFDFVVCDSVFNSVDSKEAEMAVAILLNAFCKPGGMVFFSGRKRERVDTIINATKIRDTGRYIEFLDEDGFTALFRKGRWFFQKFHTEQQVKELADTMRINLTAHVRNASATSWQAAGVKIENLPIEKIDKACDFEFDMPLPGGKSIGMAEKMRAAFAAAMGG